jgi:hypothetical protein
MYNAEKKHQEYLKHGGHPPAESEYATRSRGGKHSVHPSGMSLGRHGAISKD